MTARQLPATVWRPGAVTPDRQPHATEERATDTGALTIRMDAQLLDVGVAVGDVRQDVTAG